jgi:LPS sulfotransferase NodH
VIMSKNFDYFVVLAEMRTGSNFLEESLNDYPGLSCLGEAYNPAFIGRPKLDALCGVTREARDHDPMTLLAAVRDKTDGLAGFRYFRDHEPRMYAEILGNARCGKIILTRNPLESYVSHKIATQTGQWRLGDMKDARSARIIFDKGEFERLLAQLQARQLDILRILQRSGQTAFYLDYEDIRDLEVLDGLARFLGVAHKKERPTTKTKVQNPSSLRDKVQNFDEMMGQLGDFDHFDLGRTPNFEPRRGPAVPQMLACREAGLLYLPLKGAADDRIAAWLEAVGGGLLSGFNQKTLRQWKRRHPGHRSFTVLRHPVARLHTVFCRHILNPGDDCFDDIRKMLRQKYNIALPKGVPGAAYTIEQHRTAFLQFAAWVKGNLSGQTSLRVDPAWATQAACVQGFGGFMQPDLLIREDELAADLTHLSAKMGLSAPDMAPVAADSPFALEQVWDDSVEAAVKAAYQRDYMVFGFAPWSG